LRRNTALVNEFLDFFLQFRIENDNTDDFASLWVDIRFDTIIEVLCESRVRDYNPLRFLYFNTKRVGCTFKVIE
jgi:hypothetical protein